MALSEMKDLYQQRSQKRILILAAIFILWFIVLAFRLFQLQVIRHPRLKAEVLEQNQYKRDIISKRGTIYDSNGKILARSLPVKSVFYIPFAGESLDQHWNTIRQMKKILNLSEKEELRIKTRVEKNDHFIWIKRKIDDETAERMDNPGLPGVFFQEENKRFYPSGTRAAHVLGGVDIDDKGQSGVEYKYNEILQGEKGECLILRDAKKRKYDVQVLKEALPGKDLILTIDETIQYIAEKELEKAVLSHNANWGTIIISEPSSGEILAMASYPTYSPAHYPPDSPEAEVNRAIRQNFEPGSTFKIITATAAKELNAVQTHDIFDCSEGRFLISGWSIRDHKTFGILTFPEVFIHSSNVGAIQIGQKLGKEQLYSSIKSFKFGEKTGIDLPGEEMGIFHPLEQWTKFSLPSISIGYELSVTAIQVLQAMNIIANRGILVKPKIVKAVTDTSGERDSDTSPPERVISEKASSELISQIFERVVEEGTGQAAQIPGYRVAGKTGTAQKYDPAIRGYSSRKHLASFVGFVPADKPSLSLIVVIDEPKAGLSYGGQVAAPVFREIAQRVLLYLRVPPQNDFPKEIITARIGNGEGE